MCGVIWRMHPALRTSDGRQTKAAHYSSPGSPTRSINSYGSPPEPLQNNYAYYQAGVGTLAHTHTHLYAHALEIWDLAHFFNCLQVD